MLPLSSCIDNHRPYVRSGGIRKLDRVSWVRQWFTQLWRARASHRGESGWGELSSASGPVHLLIPLPGPPFPHLFSWMSWTRRGLPCYLACKPSSYLATVSWMLAEDITLFGQRQRTLLLTAISVARVSAFSCAGSLSPSSHREGRWHQPIQGCFIGEEP